MAEDIKSDSFHQYINIIGVPSRKKNLLVVLCISFVLSFVVIAFVVMSTQYQLKTTKYVQYAAFQNSLNSFADPCVDFYNFTCDLWSHKNPIPEYKYKTSTFSVLQNEVNIETRNIFENTEPNERLPNVVNYAIQFYNLCSAGDADISDICDVLFPFFKEAGGYPLLNITDFDENHFDWMNSTIFIKKRLGLDIVFSVGISLETDIINAIQIKRPELQYVDPQYIHVALTNLNISYDMHDFYDTFNINAEWQSLFYDSRNVSNSNPVVITVKDLLMEAPEIEWIKYFNLILSNTNCTISDNHTVIIPNMNYVKTVSKVLGSNRFTKRQLSNLFNTFVIGKLLFFVPGYLNAYNSVFGPESDERIKAVTKDNCYNVIENVFQSSLDYLYIKNFSSLNTVDSKVLSENIKTTFLELLQNSVWLDDESKEAAALKLDKMKIIVGYPDYFANKTLFDKLYENFPDFTNNIVKNYFQVYEFKQKMLQWQLPRAVTHVSAYYDLKENSIVFPLSLHNPPFYYSMGPSYLNYGAVGVIIAHEITHGFGEYKDVFSINNPFTNATNNLFLEHTKCFINKYDNYDESGLYRNNGKKTLRENIADSEGLRIAYKAYKKFVISFENEIQVEKFSMYTPDQMFFIAFGTAFCSNFNLEVASNLDTHSFPNLRVNGAVSNSRSFSKAFNCPVDSPMNPSEKCELW